MQLPSRWLPLLSVCLWIVASASQAISEEAAGVSSRDVRSQAIQSVPLGQLNPTARREVSEVLRNPSFFRRMPTQQIDCDRQMLEFLVRRPEVMVNIWDMMGITKVSAQRVSPFAFTADDGVGTTCKCDLVYSDQKTHVYVGTGRYSGTMAPRNVTGKCVCVLHTAEKADRSGQRTVVGTMDVFLKLDNFGADIITRTLGPFVGKTADYNFVETAKFVSQISQICSHSPGAAQTLAMKLNKVDSTVQREFASIAAKIAMNTVPKDSARQLGPSHVDQLRSDHSRTQAPLVGNSPGSSATAATMAREEAGWLPSPNTSDRYGSDRPVSRVRAPELTTVEASSGANSSGGWQQAADAAEQTVLAPGVVRPRKQNIYMRR